MNLAIGKPGEDVVHLRSAIDVRSETNCIGWLERGRDMGFGPVASCVDARASAGQSRACGTNVAEPRNEQIHRWIQRRSIAGSSKCEVHQGFHPHMGAKDSWQSI